MNGETDPSRPYHVDEGDPDIKRYFRGLTEEQAARVLASERVRDSHRDSQASPGTSWGVLAKHDKVAWDATGDPYDIPAKCDE